MITKEQFVDVVAQENGAENRPAAAPSAAYLGTIVRGLAEVHDLGHEALAQRLHGQQLLNNEATGAV